MESSGFLQLEDVSTSKLEKSEYEEACRLFTQRKMSAYEFACLVVSGQYWLCRCLSSRLKTGEFVFTTCLQRKACSVSHVLESMATSQRVTKLESRYKY